MRLLVAQTNLFRYAELVGTWEIFTILAALAVEPSSNVLATLLIIKFSVYEIKLPQTITFRSARFKTTSNIMFGS